MCNGEKVNFNECNINFSFFNNFIWKILKNLDYNSYVDFDFNLYLYFNQLCDNCIKRANQSLSEYHPHVTKCDFLTCCIVSWTRWRIQARTLFKCQELHGWFTQIDTVLLFLDFVCRILCLVIFLFSLCVLTWHAQ